jgi:hypothetical protein
MAITAKKGRQRLADEGHIQDAGANGLSPLPGSRCRVVRPERRELGLSAPSHSVA